MTADLHADAAAISSAITVIDQTAALAKCPYCDAFPEVPCVLHRERGDD